MFDLKGKKIWVAGHSGMVGSALVRRLAAEDCELLLVDHRDLDLRCQDATNAWMSAMKPDVIFIAAAKVGGIAVNASQPGQFFYDNMMIEANIIEQARRLETEKLMLLGSSCIYPRACTQPMTEDSLFKGELEPTNVGYAVAKIAGVTMCQTYAQQYGCNFISALPTNLYGVGDNFDPLSSHVVSAMIRKVYEAKQSGGRVEIWGTGRARREFMYVDDAADGLVFLMKYYDQPDVINVAGGQEVSITQLYDLVCDVVGYKNEPVYLTDKPDGMPRKLLSSDKIANFGWRPSLHLSDGLAKTYDWFLQTSAIGTGGK
ncbi:GDP-L-fucose synthase family protein [Terasakiella pusilla]|uniref:GDP-L-fucose synthase family protein n=1 Tax=Terasakiella pusilla TaxID=64973 RepID=UPI003AA7D8CF